MKDNERTIVLDAAKRVDAAAQKLGAAYRDLTAGIAEALRASFHAGGKEAADDLNAVVGNGRLAEEVAGLLVAVGLNDVIQAPRARGVTPVADFYPRWKERIDRVPESPSRSRSTGGRNYA
jgi:hypothetical protein